MALAFDLRGLAFMSKDDDEAALWDFDKAVRLKPQSTRFHCDRGNAHRAVRTYEAALVDYHNAIALEPEFADALYQRGRTYRHLGDESRTKDDFAAAKRLGPTVTTRMGESL